MKKKSKWVSPKKFKFYEPKGFIPFEEIMHLPDFEKSDIILEEEDEETW